jgi:hypothetical protein
MTDFPDHAPDPDIRPPAWLELACLLCLHIVTSCLSLVYVAEFYAGYQIVWFDKTGLYAAAQNVALFAIVSALFTVSRISFGYFLGFYFYTLVLGYLWIVEFSRFHYNHSLSAFSAFASAVAFLVPALFITSPIRQRFRLSPRALDNSLTLILVLAAAIIAAGSLYNFRLISVEQIYDFRGELEFPGWLRYAIAVTSNALLPFAFACFVALGNRWRAAAVLLLFLPFYPITLTRTVLFAPFWLLFLALLSRFFAPRTTVILSLLVPVSGGIVLALLVKSGLLQFIQVRDYFGATNFRMVAIPAIALDLYNDFFSTHDHTHYCQILLLKRFVSCPYSDPLSVLMAKAYLIGNVNASLFATEGIASVGPVLAPLVALACGLVISLGNRLSSGLPPRFILLSGGVVLHAFLNVPLTTALVTGGATALFLLWYVMPRTIFEQKTISPTALAH